MNIIKRIFGIIWILLAPVCLYFLIVNALHAFAKADKAIEAAATEAAKTAAEAAKTNTILQWSIIIIIFLPIAAGLVIFGKYAFTGEYDSTAPAQNTMA
ncbi:MAG TPA: hypothetical protein VG738_06190 [Chitinophagaceae bacterium]|nr:hypothetical protein [Chitinophagaceae bacterium]